MKILMICDFFVEELEYQENLLAKYYVKFGHDVRVITSLCKSFSDYAKSKYTDKNISENYLFDGIRIYREKYEYSFLNRIRKLSNVLDILRAESPDLIFAHGIDPNLLEVKKYLKEHVNCKFIVDFHGDLSNSGKNWLSLFLLHKIIRKKFILDRVMDKIDKIFPITPSSKDFLNKYYQVRTEKMEVLPLGADMDLKKFVFENINREAVRLSLGINKDDFVIFTGGKFTHLKKTDVLLDAVEQMKLENVHVVMVGSINKDYWADINPRIQRNRNIHFLGWQSPESVYKFMSISDIAVFPQSQSVLWQQSIGAGLPLIVGMMPGYSIDYLNVYNNIIIIDHDDISVDIISHNIQRLYKNKTLLHEMAHGANQVATEMLDWNILLSRTLKF